MKYLTQKKSFRVSLLFFILIYFPLLLYRTEAEIVPTEKFNYRLRIQMADKINTYLIKKDEDLASITHEIDRGVITKKLDKISTTKLEEKVKTAWNNPKAIKEIPCQRHSISIENTVLKTGTYFCIGSKEKKPIPLIQLANFIDFQMR